MGVIESDPLPHARGRELGKRLADITAASILAVLALPVVAAGALAVLFLDGRPVLFGHRRVGRHGRTFRCWKLRTMVADAEERLEDDPALRGQYRGNGYKLRTRDDPRVTRVGRWLRRTYADELPQLYNVLRGDMSIVGPRPVVEEELSEYGSGAHTLLSVRPGVFGAWTVLGRRRPPYPRRAEIELAYVRDPRFSRDMWILLSSVRSVLQGEPDE